MIMRIVTISMTTKNPSHSDIHGLKPDHDLDDWPALLITTVTTVMLTIMIITINMMTASVMIVVRIMMLPLTTVGTIMTVRMTISMTPWMTISQTRKEMFNKTRLYVHLHNFLIYLFIQHFSQHVSVVHDHH
jgi:hypothetical protein